MYSSKYCNICLTYCASLKNLQDNKEILCKLKYCVSEKMYEQDNIPEFICLKCCEQLDTACVFKQMCIRNHVVVQTITCIRNKTVETVKDCKTDSDTIFEVTCDNQTRNSNIKTEIEVDNNINFESMSCSADSKIIQEQNERDFFPPYTKKEMLMLGHEHVEENYNLVEDKRLETSLHEEINLKVEEIWLENSHAYINEGFSHTQIFSCRTCGKAFVNQHNLEIHERTHSGERPFACDRCNRCFVAYTLLQKHQRTHTGEKPFKCRYENCSKAFSRQESMRRHIVANHFIRCHRKEEPISCKTCGKAFINQYNLKVHERTHSGERPFACDRCDRCFVTYAQLQNHLRTHTGEKPYQCRYENCTRAFSRSESMRRHMRLIHKVQNA